MEAAATARAEAESAAAARTDEARAESEALRQQLEEYKAAGIGSGAKRAAPEGGDGNERFGKGKRPRR